MESESLDIGQVIEASTRAYGLLVWLGDLVDAEKISVSDARRVLRSPEGAAKFVARHKASLPADLTPSDAEAERLTSNILGTYLAVSFDLGDAPGQRWVPDPVCGPGCPWCWHVTKGPHLVVKSLTKSDKRRAREAATRALQQMVDTMADSVDQEAVERVVAAHLEEAAVMAYANALIARARHRTASTTSLALWRMFAWSKGSPRKNFRFDLPLVERSRGILRDALLETSR